MQKVITATEASGFYLNHDYRPDKNNPFFLRDSVCYNACEIAELIEAKGIVVFTFSGSSAVKIASYRPNCKIFSFAVDHQVMRQLSLVRGVKVFPIDHQVNINDATDHAIGTLGNSGYLSKGDKAVFVGGIPMKKREQVNMLKVTEI